MNKFNHVLITGASSGIGEALAIHYAKSGVKLLSLCGRNKERLDKTAEECRKFGVEVDARIVDVRMKKDVEAWINEANKKMPLNLVFANAGVATLEETTDNVRRTFFVNVLGVINTVLPVIDLFKKAPAEQMKHIAITSSILARAITRP